MLEERDIYSTSFNSSCCASQDGQIRQMWSTEPRANLCGPGCVASLVFARLRPAHPRRYTSALVSILTPLPASPHSIGPCCAADVLCLGSQPLLAPRALTDTFDIKAVTQERQLASLPNWSSVRMVRMRSPYHHKVREADISSRSRPLPERRQFAQTRSRRT